MVVQGAVLPDVLDLDALEEGFRVRRIRERLLRPTLEERVAQVRARYGRVYTLTQLRATASARRRGRARRCEHGFMESIEAYEAPIPDDALLRYEDASETTWFWRFHVVMPISSRAERPLRWIVGEVRGGADLYAIVARWHTAAARPTTAEPQNAQNAKGAIR